MKRLFCVLLSLLTVLSLFAACSTTEKQETTNNKKEETGVNQTETETPEGPNTNAEEENTVKEEKDELKSITAPITGVWVQCNAARKVSESGFARLIDSGNDTTAAFCLDVLNPYTGTLDGVFDHFKVRFPASAAISCQGDINSSEMELIDSEKVTMAGFDSIRFTGKVPNKSGWDCHVYGYTFLIDSVPYAVIGIVSDASQSEDLIAFINAEVDAIAATIKKG